jgi:hypothetical protein
MKQTAVHNKGHMYTYLHSCVRVNPPPPGFQKEHAHVLDPSVVLLLLQCEHGDKFIYSATILDLVSQL